MYEIWLMLNIAWESLLGAWPVVLPWLIATAVATLLALARRGTDWRGARKLALGGALVAGVLAFAMLPALTASSMRELKYWVDWLALAGVAAAAAAAAGALLWPMAALVKSRTYR